MLQEMLKKRDKIDVNTEKPEFTQITRRIRKRAKFLKNEYMENEARQINQAWYNRELEKVYYLAKNQKMGKTVQSGSKCPTHLLKNHVENHLNNGTELPDPEEITTNIPECLKTGKNVPFDDNGLSVGAPSKEELLEVYKSPEK